MGSLFWRSWVKIRVGLGWYRDEKWIHAKRRGGKLQNGGDKPFFPAELDEVFLSFSSATGHGAFLGALGR
jgi:hypothetical protein